MVILQAHISCIVVIYPTYITNECGLLACLLALGHWTVWKQVLVNVKCLFKCNLLELGIKNPSNQFE